MSSTNYQALGRDVFRAVEQLSNILDSEIKPLLDGENNDSQLKECSYLLFTRVWCWIGSLRKLNSPTDYQAQATCARALLECTADIIFLAHNVEPPTKMLGWTDSAHLNMATLLVNHFQAANQPINPEYQEHQNFVQQNEQTIKQQRLALWGADKNGNPKHPKRWTGSGELPIDLGRIDRLQEPLINTYLGMPLMEFYRGIFSPLSWGIHGSGLALTRNPALSPDGNSFYVLSATFHKFSIDLAIISTLSVLNIFGISGRIPDLEQRLGRIKMDCYDAWANF